MAVTWKGNLTKHFTLEEYTVGNAKSAKIYITREAMLQAEMLEEFRVWLGRPMIVTCWFRTPAYNKKVGGVANSNHLTGCATDWHTNVEITQQKFIKYADKWKEICKKHGIVGEAGLYGWGMHLGSSIKYSKTFYHWDSRSGKQINMPFAALK